jgi:DNA ligase-1
MAEVAEVSRIVAATSARLAKIAALASVLRAATPDEAPIVVAWLSGELPQRQIGVGWASLRDRPSPAGEPMLTVAAVDETLGRIGAASGKGSAASRKKLVGDLLRAATGAEQYFLIRLLSGELRQGALDGVMIEAVARAAEVPVTDVRRAVMLSGSLPATAQAALGGGRQALAGFGLQAGRPVKPMLASSAPSLDEALAKIAAQAGGDAADPAVAAAIEWKLDGIRIQAHVFHGAEDGGESSGEEEGNGIRLFTRTLDDITARLPEVVAEIRKLPVRSGVFDGELIALRPDGSPYPFQDTAARAARDVPASEMPLSVFLFDMLHLDGEDLLDLPDEQRHEALAEVVPEEMRMPRLVTASAPEATAFFEDALAHGHEGVVVKSLSTPYAAGRRGAGWIKVKPRHTLDLVVLAVEWGHGRRDGWLSNLHLGARDPSTGQWVMLGKTFKGLTDELLEWQTRKLQEIEDHRDDWTVYVRPELVVEIAFDGVQRSPRYPGGVALRFARVLRYREDKPAAEADTIDTVRALAQLPSPAAPGPLLAGGPQVVARGQQPDPGLLVERPPQPAAREQGDNDRHDAEDDQVPGVELVQRLEQHHVHDGAEDRPLDGADAADDHRERHLGCPLHAEYPAGRSRRHSQLLDGEDTAGGAAADGRDHEHQRPRESHANPGTARGGLVVADGGQDQADAGPEQEV